MLVPRPERFTRLHRLHPAPRCVVVSRRTWIAIMCNRRSSVRAVLGICYASPVNVGSLSEPLTLRSLETPTRDS